MVETVANCVILPHQINWRDRPRHSRKWSTVISGGVTGGEDRLSGSTGYKRGLEYVLTTFGLGEQVKLSARLLAAHKSGRACVPYFGRGQVLVNNTQGNEVEGLSYPPIGVFNHAVVESGWYSWTPGPNESQLQNGAQTIFAAQSFMALNSGVTLIGTQPNQPVTAQLRRIDGRQAATAGLWTWRPGDYAFFMRPFSAINQEVGFENRDLLIDSGSEEAEEPWFPDGLGTGGDPVATGISVDRTDVRGWNAPGVEIYQSARNISSLAAPMPAAWSLFVGAWQVTGLTPGQRYFYRKGDHDEGGLVSINADGTFTNLSESGSFIAGQTFCEIYAPEVQAPGTVHFGAVIQYILPNLIKGVPCNLRLHFAEIEAGFDGSVARRIFTVQVRGDRLLTSDGFEPYAAAGNVLNRAAVLDFTVTPDTDGKVTVTLIPEGPDFFAGINGLELYQRSWEVVHLAAGSGANLMVWDGEALKGVYESGWLVFPAFFGRLSADTVAALTGQLANLRIMIAEPLGDGDLGVNACPAEVCVPDPPLVGRIKVPVWNGPNLTCDNRQTEQFQLEDPEGNLRRVGVTLDENGNGLEPGVLDQWAAAIWDKWEAYKTANGIQVMSEQPYWQDTGNDAQPGVNANGVFLINSWHVAQHWRYEIWIEYCPIV